MLNQYSESDSSDESENYMDDDLIHTNTWETFNHQKIEVPKLKMKLIEKTSNIVIDSIDRLKHREKKHPCNFIIRFGISEIKTDTLVNRLYKNNSSLNIQLGDSVILKHSQSLNGLTSNEIATIININPITQEVSIRKQTGETLNGFTKNDFIISGYEYIYNNTEINSRRAIYNINNLQYNLDDIVTIKETVVSTDIINIKTIYKNITQIELVKISVPFIGITIDDMLLSDLYNYISLEIKNLPNSLDGTNNSISNAFAILTPINRNLPTNINGKFNLGYIDYYPTLPAIYKFEPAPLSKLDRLELHLKDCDGNTFNTDYIDYILVDTIEVDTTNKLLIVKTQKYFFYNSFSIGDKVHLNNYKEIVTDLNDHLLDNTALAQQFFSIDSQTRSLINEFVNIIVDRPLLVKDIIIETNKSYSNEIHLQLPIDLDTVENKGILEYDKIYESLFTKSFKYTNNDGIEIDVSTVYIYVQFITQTISNIYLYNYSKRYLYTFKFTYLVPYSHDLTVNKYI